MFDWLCSAGHHYGTETYAWQKLIIIGTFGGLALPFCFAKHLGALRYQSTITVVYVVFLGLVCTGKAIKLLGESRHGVPGGHRPAFQGLTGATMLDLAPVVAFAFSSVACVFHVHAEAKDKRRMRAAVHTPVVRVAAEHLLQP